MAHLPWLWEIKRGLGTGCRNQSYRKGLRHEIQPVNPLTESQCSGAPATYTGPGWAPHELLITLQPRTNWETKEQQIRLDGSREISFSLLWDEVYGGGKGSADLFPCLGLSLAACQLAFYPLFSRLGSRSDLSESVFPGQVWKPVGIGLGWNRIILTNSGVRDSSGLKLWVTRS